MVLWGVSIMIYELFEFSVGMLLSIILLTSAFFGEKKTSTRLILIGISYIITQNI